MDSELCRTTTDKNQQLAISKIEILDKANLSCKGRNDYFKRTIVTSDMLWLVELNPSIKGFNLGITAVEHS